MSKSVSQCISQAFARKALAAAIATASVGAAVLPSQVYAQNQTSAITGRVYDAQGNPAANVEVTVVDTRSGTRRTVSSNDSGSYTVRNLAVGGPYAVSVNGVRQSVCPQP